MNNLDKQYTDLLQDILNNGVKKGDRTGTGTLSVFGRQIRHKMSDGFPLLTTKKIPFKTMVTELIWFLRGDTNIKFLVDNNCHIWDGDAYTNYRMNVQEYGKLPNPNDVKSMEMITDTQGNFHPSSVPFNKEEFINKIKTDDGFAKKWGELGPIYGKQWRKWDVPRMEPNGFNFDKAWEKSQELWKSSNGMECGPSFETFCMSLLRSKKMGITYGYHTQIDQIQNSINLLKTDPDSRRNIVSAWNVGEMKDMVLPPCHNFFQFYTRELSFWERRNLAYDYAIKNEKIPLSIDAYGRKGIPEYMETINDTGWNIPTRAVSLMWNQRSVDTFLGLPFNIASYGLLLEIIAKEVNMVPDELIGNLGDVHLYLNHIEQAREQIGREYTDDELKLLNPEWFEVLKEKLAHIKAGDYEKAAKCRDREKTIIKNISLKTREPFPLPTVKLDYEGSFLNINLEKSNFILENYQCHSEIKAPLSN